jgi:Arc/MetJ-type ribon-helix-helix transcriptional regulator
MQEEYMLKEIKLAELRREIQKGSESGSPKELDIEDVVSRGKKRLASKHISWREMTILGRFCSSLASATIAA